jgi:hypothetical protein
MLDKPVSAREHTCGEVLRWPTPRSRDWTDAFLESAGSNSNVVAVVAIGSAVRPQVPSADVDLVVICRDRHLLDEIPPLEVDLRVYSAAEVNARLEAGHDVLGWAVKFGRVLFQRDCFWDRVVESCRDRLRLPSSKLARARAAAAYRHLTNVFQSGDADAMREQALAYLTHLARAALLERGIYPASRPELCGQLRGVGNYRLAEWLHRILQDDSTELSQIDRLLKLAIEWGDSITAASDG